MDAPPEETTKVGTWPEHELRYWAEKLSCSVDELREAVSAVGGSLIRVRRYLTGRPKHRPASAVLASSVAVTATDENEGAV